jgi:superfamily II DNA/RNA helicase
MRFPSFGSGLSALHVPLDLPDLWQQEAVGHLKEGYDVVIDAPTGAGKTRVFELFFKSPEAQRLGQAVYTVPTRALANDKWSEWKKLGWNVGIATGDVAENLAAPVVVATLETQRERILTGNAPDLLVLDEYQMISDPNRGLNYEMAMALPPPSTRLLLLSGSVRNPTEIVEWLKRLGRRVHLIQVKNRPVPLDDFSIENLPRVPSHIHGYWPRIAAGAVLGGLTPLLIFAPRRREAEKMAQQIAAALTVESPLSIPQADQAMLGRDLTRLLQKRVAYHHSGLPYSARSKWIEPLGKEGKLDVIVATTGLAAGINFSVKAVMVSSTTYGDGRFQRELRADELLQMFGRAGRRGIDEEGFVLVGNDTPRLMDAAPRQLRRVNQIDWPTLLRVMEEGGESDATPIARAVKLCERLFSRQSISPLLEDSLKQNSINQRYEPTRVEYFGSDQIWHPQKSARLAQVHLSECLIWHRERWIPALKSPASLDFFPTGRPCKIGKGADFAYAKEVPVARVSNAAWLPLPWIQKKLGLGKKESFTLQALEQTVMPLLAPEWAPARFHQLQQHGNNLMAQLALDAIPTKATIMPNDTALLQAPTRRVDVSEIADTPSEFDPPRGSPAFIWKKLGLVDNAGVPTARGRVFSRFQNGEGLMIAAALEDPAYPVEDIVKHLANLRGGPRFTDFADGPSLRLATSARELYGHVDYEGYLVAGLCPGFGEGTWEALEIYNTEGLKTLQKETESIRRGDLERANLEWKSLLRHILHASNPSAPRWAEFQSAAAAQLHVARS